MRREREHIRCSPCSCSHFSRDLQIAIVSLFVADRSQLSRYYLDHIADRWGAYFNQQKLCLLDGTIHCVLTVLKISCARRAWNSRATKAASNSFVSER